MKGHKAEIGLRLTTTRGEIEQVNDLTVCVVRIDHTVQVHQNESNLEWTPAEVIVRISGIDIVFEIAFDPFAMRLGIV